MFRHQYLAQSRAAGVPALRLFSLRVRCSSATVTAATAPAGGAVQLRPSAAEVSRTIMELSETGTLSTSVAAPGSEENGIGGWPLGIGARFVVDAEGIPALCLGTGSEKRFALGGRSSFHVGLNQNGARTPQCSLLGILSKPEDGYLMKKLQAKWEKKFGEELDSSLVYVVSVDRVLHMEDFKEDGTWVSSSEYMAAEPDPLRNFADKLVHEMNDKHSEDVQRLCSVYVETDVQVTNTKMIWVDRLGFDLHIQSEGFIFEARIPFPREVTDEKGVKSTFNSMSHLAWEVEKHYVPPDFEKVKPLKRIR